MKTKLDPVEQIRGYLATQWKPIRLHGQSKRPIDDGWPERVFSEEALIDWHNRGGGIGIQVGPVSDNICAVDLDIEEARILAPHFLPDTLKAGKEEELLPSHYIYRSEGASYLQIRDGEKEAIALKASGPANKYAGHQFVVAPSSHEKKGDYIWVGGFDPPRVKDVGPESLTESIRQLGVAALILRHLPEEGRHEYSKAVAGTFLRRGYDADTLAEIMRIVWEAADAPREGIRDVQKNVYSTAKALEDYKPVTAKTRLNEIVAGLGDSLVLAAGLKQHDDVGKEDGSDAKPRPLDDLALAQRWLYKHKNLRFSEHGWLHYKDGYWRRVEDGLISRSITKHVGSIPDLKVTANRVHSVTKLAEAQSYVKTDQWDAKRHIIVCANGTLDLDTFELRDHRPEDYALGGLPFDYDPNAVAPAWNHFIGGHLGEEKWRFLQEFAGYCLTTDTSYEIALWLVGPAGSGKSTFLEGIGRIMGDRLGNLSLADIERSAFALENIVGKTLLTATEQPSMFIRQVDILNALISGEPVKINRKNKAIIDVRPVAKLAWAMNAKPRIREEGNGIFRRLQIVEFPELDPHKRDPNVKQRIMQVEAAGILAWAVEGLKRLRSRDGFVVPPSVSAAVKEFEYVNDPPRQFFDEMCEPGDDHDHVGKKELYDAYALWCKHYGFKPKAVNQIREDWLRLGLKEGAVHGKRHYKRVKLVEAPDKYFDRWEWDK
jgi:P4 family phage/plasmid primase-like protien